MKSVAVFVGACALFALLGAVGYLGLEFVAGGDRAGTEVAPGEAIEADGRLGATGRTAAGDGSASEVDGQARGVAAVDWARTNNDAVRALEAGECERAIELLERCIAAEPEEPVFRRNLASALIAWAIEQRGDGPPCADCLASLERALELAPERDDVERLVAKWRTEADVQRGFWEESSLYFDLAYDGSRDGILRDSYRVLNHLDQIYAKLRELFGADPVREGRPRIPVVLYAPEEFGAVTGLGDWAGGAFDGTVRVPVRDDVSLDDPRLQAVLAHEVAHAFVHATGGKNVPGWLNEGLAQWFEPQAQYSVASARQRLAGLELHELFTLATLEGSLATWSDPERISLAYAQSLAFCDFLARQYGERVLYRMVLAAPDSDPSESFRAAVGVELETAFGDFAAEL